MRGHKENWGTLCFCISLEGFIPHQGKAEERGIYGEATPTEVTALVDDGVPVAPMPPAELKKSEVN